MPRYEIVAHLVCELGCADAEEAAAIVGHDLAGAPGATLVIQHLAVWRQDPPPAVSPLPAPARQQLLAFFAALARASDAAETAFRGRVAALLTPPLGEMGEGEPTDGSAHSSRDQSADR
jgi:hypothetical protein